MRVPELQAPQIQRTGNAEGLVESIGLAANEYEKQKSRERTRILNENRLEATTKLEELQFEAEKLPWDQRAAHFQAGANALKAELDKRTGSDSALKEAFANDWGQLYLPRNSQVRFSARKGEIDHNVAVLDQTTTVFARQAAQASDPREAQFIKDQAALAIADAQHGGFLNEVEAGDRLRGFARGVERNRARALIEANPIAGLKSLQDTSQFQNLQEEDRLMLVDRAQSELQHRAAMADAAANRSERQRRIMGDQLAKDGWDLIAKGEMTSEWMTNAKATLDSNDYKALVSATQSGGGKDAANLVADAYEKVYLTGEDVGSDVIQGLRNRTLSPETASKLLEENKQTQGVKSPAQQGRTFITTYLKPSELNPAPGAPERLAGAMQEFDDQLRANPKLGAMEMKKLANDIVKRYSIVNRDEITVTLPTPKFAVGDRNTFDVPKTRAAIAKNFLAKHGGDKASRDKDPDYIRELRNLKLWEDARKRAAEAAAAASEDAQ